MTDIVDLPEKIKIKFYDFICSYEHEIGKDFGRFNWQDRNMQSYLHTNGLIVGSFCASNMKAIRNRKEYLLFDTKKPSKIELKGKQNDIVHNLLRHLRNAMAHGLINKRSKSSKYLVIEDYSISGIKTMDGKLTPDHLFMIINQCIATKQ